MSALDLTKLAAAKVHAHHALGYDVVDFHRRRSRQPIYCVSDPATPSSTRQTRPCEKTDVTELPRFSSTSEFAIGRQVNHPGPAPLHRSAIQRTASSQGNRCALIMELFDGRPSTCWDSERAENS